MRYIEHELDQYWNIVTKSGILTSQNIFQMTLKGSSVELLKIIHPSLSYNEALVVCNMSTLHLRREQLCQSFFKNKVVPSSSPLSELVEIAADPGYDLRAGRKFEPIKCMTNRFKNSFIPSSVKQFNASRT